MKKKRLIVSIFKKYLSDSAEIFLFGSRVNGTADNRSDLDVLIKGGKTIDLKTIALIRDEFESSDLEFKVDLLDFHSISDKMYQNIAKSLVKII